MTKAGPDTPTDDLPPVATANVKQAMVLLWNACNDLALIHEEPGCD